MRLFRRARDFFLAIAFVMGFALATVFAASRHSDGTDQEEAP